MANSDWSALVQSPGLASWRPSARPPRRQSRARSLRVCHLGKYYPPHWGGIETHVRLLASAQAAEGVDVRIICVNHLDRNAQNVRTGNLERTTSSEEQDGRVQVVRLGRIASVAKFDVCPDLLGVLRGLRDGAADVVHLHVPNPLMLLGLALIPPRAPLVVTYHSDVVHQRVLGKALRPFEHWGLRRAARIVSNSPDYANGSTLLQRYASKVEVVPMGIDLRIFSSPSAAARGHADQLRARYGGPLWLSVGRLVPYKGHEVAIEALRHTPGRLMIVGEGPLEQRLRQLAVGAGVAERVIWRGAIPQAELVGSYHAATALWFPSNARSEAFGLVQVEAMASGCPVINCAIADSGVPWVSQHEKTGLTVRVGDAHALAAAARRLIHDSSLSPRLRAAAAVRALREFDHRRMARRYLDLYSNVLGQGGDASLHGRAPSTAAELGTH